uniref:Uncharacterized protein n=1 Tax=Oryza nivara TaxID=4536 RepID=A0A0E0G4B9_ORYNI
MLDRTSSPCRSRPLLRNIVDFRSPSSKLLSSTHIVLLLEENAGRSATTRCPQGVISSGCVPNHLAGVAVDTAEPPKSIDGEALPANASLSPSSSAARRRRPLPGRQGASCRYPEVVNISSTSRDGYRRTPVASTCHDAPLVGRDVPLILY